MISTPKSITCEVVDIIALTLSTICEQILGSGTLSSLLAVSGLQPENLGYRTRNEGITA